MVLGIVGEVGKFHGVGVYVEEHGAVAGVFAEFGVAKLFGADGGAVDGGSVFAPDAEGGLCPVGAWVVEERREAGAFDARGNFEIAELGYRAVDVERLDDAGGGAAAPGMGGIS